ncbi:MAG TPA: hypothetical protein DDW37_06455 [Verrucomicrobiales bacterium]|nr:hypothetical protein [Verrucomicrobiales bacterium]
MGNKSKMALTKNARIQMTRDGLERSTKNHDFLYFILGASSTWQFPPCHHILAFLSEGTASADSPTTFRP